MADPVNTGFEGPPSTPGFGPRESADETRQAQQTMANDMPVDVNMNAIFARAQATTLTIAGNEFTANSDIRQKLQDRLLLTPVKTT